MNQEKQEKKNLFQRTQDFFEENDWDIGLFLLAILAFTLDTVGFKIMFEENGIAMNLHDYMYYSIRVFGFDLQTPELNTHIPWILEFGRWLSAAVTIWAVMLAVKHIFIDKWKLYRKGDGHIVIVGAGEKGKTFMLDWIDQMENNSVDKKLIVCIEKDKNNPNIDILKDKGVTFIFGQAQDEDILKKAKVNQSNYFIILAGQDTTNIEIISTFIKTDNLQENINCYIHIINNEFYDFFRAKSFVADKKSKNTLPDIKVFNLHSNSARMLLKDKLLGENVFKNATDIKDPTKTVKIAILGFGKLAENILIHILQLGHFYNGKPVEVTVVYDEDRDENKNLKDEFNNHYDVLHPEYNKRYWDVELIDDGDFDSKKMEFDHLFIAYEDEFKSLSNLMKILKKYNDKIIDNKIDIAIYSNSFKNTAKIIEEDMQSKDETVFSYVRTFGEINKTCNYSMVINQELDDMAIKNNNHYNELHGYNDEHLSAENQWKELDIFTKDSNRYLMEHMAIKTDIINKFIESRPSPINDYEEIESSINKKFFNYKGMQPINWKNMGVKETKYATYLSEEEIINLGRLEHTRWNAFHILNGWKTMNVKEIISRKENGEKPFQKIPIKKLHSCLVNWEELDDVSDVMEHNYKSDDIETIMRIPNLEEVAKNSSI